MPASLRSRSWRARRRPSRAALAGLALAGAALAGGACLPTQPLDDYARERGAGGSAGGAGATAGAAGGGAGGGAGTASSGGAGGAEQPAPGGAGGAGAPDAGGGARDAGSLVVLDGSAPAALCAADEVLGPDERCYFFAVSLASWAAARSDCQARGDGWDLVRIRSAEQSAFLGETLAVEAWIGATDALAEGQWTWVGDALPFWSGNGTTGSANGGAYVNWNPTEPNGATATNCARALPRSIAGPASNAPWADLDCALELGAICESGAGL